MTDETSGQLLAILWSLLFVGSVTSGDVASRRYGAEFPRRWARRDGSLVETFGYCASAFECRCMPRSTLAIGVLGWSS